MDKIEIRDLEIFANHGVFPEETALGQKFVVSAVMCLCSFSWVSVLYTIKLTKHMPSKKIIRGTSVFFFTWFTSFCPWELL